VFNLKQTAGQNTSPKREPEIVNVAHIYFTISTKNVEAMEWAVAVILATLGQLCSAT